MLQTKQVRLEANLEAKRAELAQIQEDLRRERLRLARLRKRLAEARVELANRLVQIYKEDSPDVVTVVLEADGFADLLERTEFLQRTSAQDARIIYRVRDAKAEATATAERLDRLEKRAEQVAEAIEAEVVAGRRGQGPARGAARRLRVGARRQGAAARQHAGESPRARGPRRGARARAGRGAGPPARRQSASPARSGRAPGS